MDAGVEDRIEEVLAQDPPRFRVRWDDGGTSSSLPRQASRGSSRASESA